MTNVQIIDAVKAGLVAEGKIKANEEIHTYKHWRILGYQVFRGSKAVAAVNIWQYFTKKKEDSAGDDEEQPKETGKMRMRKAFFFSSSQVFAIEGD